MSPSSHSRSRHPISRYKVFADSCCCLLANVQPFSFMSDYFQTWLPGSGQGEHRNERDISTRACLTSKSQIVINSLLNISRLAWIRKYYISLTLIIPPSGAITCTHNFGQFLYQREMIRIVSNCKQVQCFVFYYRIFDIEGILI